MSNKSPAFQWYPKDFLADENVVLMSLEEQGAYVRLLCYCWLEGSIPGDVEQLARLCQTDADHMRVLWNALDKCFNLRGQEGGQRYVHLRLEAEHRKQDKHREAKSRAGSVGAKSRWEKAENGSAIVLPLADNGDLPLAENGSSSSTASSSSPTDTYTASFEEWWNHYPRKVEKRTAFKAWKARLRAGVTVLRSW